LSTTPRVFAGQLAAIPYLLSYDTASVTLSIRYNSSSTARSWRPQTQ
jgi:hypothetical protein